MPDNATTWRLIHTGRAALADTLDKLTPEQWATPSLCAGWSIQQAAGHVVAGAEQTAPGFLSGMAANGFRFNKMMDRDARRLGALPPEEIVARLRARTTTTNHPPAPIMAMLGEIVVHGEDIRHPLGLPGDTEADATVACLEMYKTATFPVGAKKRIAGLRLVATDTDWAHGAGPELSGPGMSLVLVMAGRSAGLEGLTGDGLAVIASRLPSSR